MKDYLINNLDTDYYGENFTFDLLTDSTLEKIKVLDDLIKAINEKLDVTSIDNIEEVYYNSLNNRLDKEFLKTYNRGFGNGNGYFIADLLSIIDNLLSRSTDYYYQFDIKKLNKNLLIIEDLKDFLNKI